MSRDIVFSDRPLERLQKLLPAELTGAYIAIRALTSPENSTDEIWLFLFAVALVGLAPILMWRVLGMRNPFTILFLMLTFVIWVANIDIVRIVEQTPYLKSLISAQLHFILEPFVIKGLLIVWAVVLVPIAMVPGRVKQMEEET